MKWNLLGKMAIVSDTVWSGHSMGPHGLHGNKLILEMLKRGGMDQEREDRS